MQILFVSTSYPANRHDWRGRFIADLLAALRSRPEVTIRLWAPPGDTPAGILPIATPAESRWLTGLLNKGGIAAMLRTRSIKGVSAGLKLLLLLRRLYRRESTADLIHVNWLQNAIPLLHSTTPLVVSILGSDFGLLRLPGMVALLRLVFKSRRCTLAPNAEWMVPALEKAFGDLARIRPVPFGVDKRWFAVQRNPDPAEKFPWIVVSRLTPEKIGPLFDWFSEDLQDSHTLHLIGPADEPSKLPAWATWHGPATPEDLRSDWYPRAAGLISLSRHNEGRPQVILEAMAAGLPVIASGIAAHRDVITHSENGWITDSRRDFKRALNVLSDSRTNHTAGRKARHWVRSHVGTWEDCANRYFKIYADLRTGRASR